MPKDQCHIISIKEGESILEALERHGYQQEYQCRQGYCGHCRMDKQDGEVEYREFPLAYIDNNQILPCCATAKTDIKLEKILLKVEK